MGELILELAARFMLKSRKTLAEAGILIRNHFANDTTKVLASHREAIVCGIFFAIKCIPNPAGNP